MKCKYLLILLVLAGITVPLTAEDQSSGSLSLVFFHFFVGDTGIAPERLTETETGMRKLLQERGGYKVVVIETTLHSDEVATLFDSLKSLHGTGKTPEAFSINEKTIPASDVEKLLHADALVVPSLAAFASEEEKRTTGGTRYKVRLKTVFDFIVMKGEATRQTKAVETMGYDADKDRALDDAIKTILPQFTYESEILLAKNRQSGILSVGDGEVFIDAGSKQGVLMGSEFTVRSVETNPDGLTTVREKALLLVSEVTEEVSVGMVMYSDGDLAEGDAVEEVPRLGLELSPYTLAFIPFVSDPEVTVYAGIRLTLSKLVYTLRPFLAVESVVFPFETYESWFPLRPFVGAEIRLHLGRLELAALPMIGLEEWLALAPGSDATFIGFGLRGLVQVSLLVSRDIKFFLEGGYEYWFETREGFLAGGGISIKL